MIPYEINTTLRTGLYSIPIIIGAIFFEKQPIFMSVLIVFGCILVAIKLSSDVQTAKARRSHYGYGDLK